MTLIFITHWNSALDILVEIKWIVKINITCLFFLIVAPNKFNYTSVTCIMFLLDSTAKKTVNNDFTLLMYAFIVSKIYCKLLSLALSRTLYISLMFRHPLQVIVRAKTVLQEGAILIPLLRKEEKSWGEKGRGEKKGEEEKRRVQRNVDHPLLAKYLYVERVRG